MEDVIWLMEALDEQINPRTQSLDDQLERIIGMRQTENTRNEDFIKMIKKRNRYI